MVRNSVILQYIKGANSMFSKFLNYFGETKKVVYSKNLYNDFITQLGGKKFGKGVFCSFNNDNIGKWTELVTEAYPKFKNKFKLFGYDWLGRCFGIDLRLLTRGKILMFEIGTDDVLEIPCSFEEFLNEEIPLHSDACLAEPFFDEWMNYSHKEMAYGRCAGYKIPLFLGGEDIVSNLEDSDMEVYWGITTQIKHQI